MNGSYDDWQVEEDVCGISAVGGMALNLMLF